MPATVLTLESTLPCVLTHVPIRAGRASDDAGGHCKQGLLNQQCGGRRAGDGFSGMEQAVHGSLQMRCAGCSHPHIAGTSDWYHLVMLLMLETALHSSHSIRLPTKGNSLFGKQMFFDQCACSIQITFNRPTP